MFVLDQAQPQAFPFIVVECKQYGPGPGLNLSNESGLGVARQHSVLTGWFQILLNVDREAVPKTSDPTSSENQIIIQSKEYFIIGSSEVKKTQFASLTRSSASQKHLRLNHLPGSTNWRPQGLGINTVIASAPEQQILAFRAHFTFSAEAKWMGQSASSQSSRKKPKNKPKTMQQAHAQNNSSRQQQQRGKRSPPPPRAAPPDNPRVRRKKSGDKVVGVDEGRRP
ncbi:hypothetical protein R3P38DRAFT_2902487 [Favolaschia claudopus]|uniref:Uncharacterized protein n=1 Tax=Favolaschia claudopus TaxID=2862362 RepID=A0AAW0CK34_9AGAR